MKPQAEKMLKTLRSGKTITVKQAQARGIANPTARIAELRAEGYDIESTPKSRGLGVVYSL